MPISDLEDERSGGRTGRVLTVIFDLNGTIADTIGVLVRTRLALVDDLASILSIHADRVVQDVRGVLRDNSHFPDLVDALPCVALARSSSNGHRRDELERALDGAVRKMRESVERLTVPRRGTLSAMSRLRELGVGVHVWTGGRLPYVVDNVRLLGLDGVVQTVSCIAQKPGVVTSLDDAVLRRTKVAVLGAAVKKPAPDVLRGILSSIGASPTSTILVGNSVAGDGGSAEGAGVRYVHAAWGTPTVDAEEQLELLTGRRPTDRSDGTVTVDCTLREEIGELFDAYDFGPDLS